MELRLCNFQAWSDAQLDLRGLTTVVGDSSRGKSSFARAIRKAVRNELMPNNIKLTTAKASIHFIYRGLDLLVERGAKAKDTSVYTVNGQVYEKLGGDIPQAVKDMNFGPVEVGGTSIDPCFAKQFDTQFLVDAKPAELNAVLNAFASTEKLDRGRKAMSAKVADINAQAKALTPQISALEEQAAALSGQIEAAQGPVALATVMFANVQTKQRAQTSLKAYTSAQSRAEIAQTHLGALETTGSSASRAFGLYKVLTRCVAAKEARQRAHEASTQIGLLARVDGAPDRASKLLKAVDAIQRLQQALTLAGTAERRITALGSLQTPLNRCLVLHKARVRVKAVQDAQVEPLQAILQQVHELPIARAQALMSAAIITNKLQGITGKLADLQTQVGGLNTDLLSTKTDYNAIEAEIEAARSAGTVTTCPKCGHEFTPSHSH